MHASLGLLGVWYVQDRQSQQPDVIDSTGSLQHLRPEQPAALLQQKKHGVSVSVSVIHVRFLDSAANRAPG